MKTQKEPQAAEPIPPGTVTMLLTDVEGSTKLWEEHPGAMRRAIRRHHELAHQAIERHGGYRPPDQGEGDSVFAVFSVVPSAVACALDFQRALTAGPWPDQVTLRVRMALHTGALELRDGHNYAGLALNRCARLRAIAHGGQVLLSEATRALIAPELPEGASLKDLGVHRLKDLSLPEQVFQLCHPDLPAEFPPLRSLDARPHSLPLQLTRSIGRAREMDEVRSIFRAARLVTLTGTGGSGKTRLALQVAADLLEEHSDGTWFVELAGTADPALVPRVVSSTIGIREQQGRLLLDTLVDYLATKATLLVLDNCEHLLDACAALADRLLPASAGLTVLATSREPLGITGEVVRRVLPLSAPEADLAPSAGAAVRGPSGRGRAALLADRCERRGRRSDLPAAGGHPAGLGTGGSPAPGPHRRSDPRPAGGPLPSLDRGQPDCPSPPADAPGDRGLEPRPPDRARAAPVPPPRRHQRSPRGRHMPRRRGLRC